MSTPAPAKPRILALMPPKSVGEEYLNEFRKDFILDVSLVVGITAMIMLTTPSSNRSSRSGTAQKLFLLSNPQLLNLVHIKLS